MLNWLRNTQFGKWAGSLKRWQTLFWSFWLLFAGFITYHTPIAGAILYIVVLLMMMIEIRLHNRRLLTLLLIASLFYAWSPRPARAQEKKAVVECNAVIIGGLIIIVGGYIVYKLIQFCKKNFPPPTPPPQNPPPTPAPTNSVPTNDVTSASVLLNPITINLDTPDKVSGYDISASNWVDHTIAEHPVLFQDFIRLSMSSSTNLTTWSNFYTIDMWLSSNSVESVIYGPNRVPVHTNWVVGNPYTGSLTNVIPFTVYDPAKPCQFFHG
jgi:hypothetical protein